MKIKQGMKQEYKEFLELNSKDGYSRGIIKYMERWADMMESEITDGVPVAVTAPRTEHMADTDGITGYMYGCAVNALSHFWKYGEDLRKWHNQNYDFQGNGVVNPAVITVHPGQDDGQLQEQDMEAGRTHT